MGEAFAFSLSAAFNPTLLAALMVMLLSTNAKRLMFGYLLGAYATSITAGLVIVFALPESSAISTARNTLSPAVDLALGLIALVVALVLATGPHQRAEAAAGEAQAGEGEEGPSPLAPGARSGLTSGRLRRGGGTQPARRVLSHRARPPSQAGSGGGSNRRLRDRVLPDRDVVVGVAAPRLRLRPGLDGQCRKALPSLDLEGRSPDRHQSRPRDRRSARVAGGDRAPELSLRVEVPA